MHRSDRHRQFDWGRGSGAKLAHFIRRVCHARIVANHTKKKPFRKLLISSASAYTGEEVLAGTVVAFSDELVNALEMRLERVKVSGNSQSLKTALILPTRQTGRGAAAATSELWRRTGHWNRRGRHWRRILSKQKHHEM